MVENNRFESQIRFVKEIDKLKQVFRQTLLIGKLRQETSSEHSWHIALMAIILLEYVEGQIDLLRVVKMLLIHDLVEIDAGDTPCYNELACQTKPERELKAANRIFNLLPIDQAHYLKLLWKEFEDCQTLDSKFANAVDRLEPLISNYYTEGKAWKKNKVRKNQVIKRIYSIKDISPKIWKYASDLVEDSVRKGILSE
jgi:putative hydrolases of HD superfamily